MKRLVFLVCLLFSVNAYAGLKYNAFTGNMDYVADASDIGYFTIVVDGTTYAQSGVGIQAAIDALTVTGGTVILREGTYNYASSITIPSNVSIVGNGYNTLLYQTASSNVAAFINSDQVSGNVGIEISNLRIDGNRANQTAAASYSNIYFKHVDDSVLSNLWITSARRNIAQSWGEGIRLTFCDRNILDNINTYDNTYDGIKLWGSNYNAITNIVATDNGRAGIQLTYDSDVVTEASDYNTVSNVSVYHSTGTPGTNSPVTSGIYVHAGHYNTISNVTVSGTGQGIGMIEDTRYNTFSNFAIRTRGISSNVAAAGIALENSACTNNKFDNITINGISGADGKYIYSNTANYNTFSNIEFEQSDGTGTWIWDVTGTNNKFINCENNEGLANVTFTNLGSLSVYQNCIDIPRETQQWTNQNALTDVGTYTNYTQLYTNRSDDLNEGIGIGFNISDDKDNIGSAIVYKATGAESQGELQFYTKQSTSAGVDPILAMVIDSSGDVDVDGTVTAENFVGTGTGDTTFNSNVGIGTTSPDSELQVVGEVRIGKDSATDIIRINHSGSTGIIDCEEDGLIIRASGAAGVRFEANGNANRVYIHSNGNVGITIDDPQQTLDVNGTIRTRPQASDTCDANNEGGIMYDSDDDHFYGCNGATNWVQLDN